MPEEVAAKDSTVHQGIRANPNRPREVQAPFATKPKALEVSPDQRTSLVGRIKRLAIAAIKEVVPIDEKIPLKEITPETDAYIIRRHIRGAITRLPKDHPFDIISVMSESGYTLSSRYSDYFEQFPQEYERFRVALQSLATANAITQQAKPPSDHNETIKYTLTPEQTPRLHEIALRAQEISPTRYDPKFL
ncbi:MAG: hypothetical protein AAB801_02785 [Patescibacteria group bacterium]